MMVRVCRSDFISTHRTAIMDTPTDLVRFLVFISVHFY